MRVLPLCRNSPYSLASGSVRWTSWRTRGGGGGGRGGVGCVPVSLPTPSSPFCHPPSFSLSLSHLQNQRPPRHDAGAARQEVAPHDGLEDGRLAGRLREEREGGEGGGKCVGFVLFFCPQSGPARTSRRVGHGRGGRAGRGGAGGHPRVGEARPTTKRTPPSRPSTPSRLARRAPPRSERGARGGARGARGCAAPASAREWAGAGRRAAATSGPPRRLLPARADAPCRGSTRGRRPAPRGAGGRRA